MEQAFESLFVVAKSFVECNACRASHLGQVSDPVFSAILELFLQVFAPQVESALKLVPLDLTRAMVELVLDLICCQPLLDEVGADCVKPDEAQDDADSEFQVFVVLGCPCAGLTHTPNAECDDVDEVFQKVVVLIVVVVFRVRKLTA